MHVSLFAWPHTLYPTFSLVPVYGTYTTIALSLGCSTAAAGNHSSYHSALGQLGDATLMTGSNL